MKICVLGGGIIGATSAFRILQEFPNFQVDIVSERFCPETTSDGTAGFWEPRHDPFTPKEKVVKWSQETFQLCESLWWNSGTVDRDLLGLEKAISLLPGYAFWNHIEMGDKFPPAYAHIWYDHHDLSSKELERFNQDSATRRGHGFVSFTLEPKIALPIFYAKLKQKGAKFIEKKIARLEELNEYDLIINCCGTGARDLVGDEHVQPIRGHVLRVQAPYVHHMLGDFQTGAYIIPTKNGLVLGSIDRKNCWSLDPIPGDREKILEGCQKLCPMLRNAPVTNEWIGLRPFRTKGVRLELETLTPKTQVIHNYGHGGSGITLAWGCAKEVVDIIQGIVKLNSKL